MLGRQLAVDIPNPNLSYYKYYIALDLSEGWISKIYVETYKRDMTKTQIAYENSRLNCPK